MELSQKSERSRWHKKSSIAFSTGKSRSQYTYICIYISVCIHTFVMCVYAYMWVYIIYIYISLSACVYGMALIMKDFGGEGLKRDCARLALQGYPD